MTPDVLDYRRLERQKAPNFWESGLGRALKFGATFILVSALDATLYTVWALSEFMGAPADKPPPGEAYVVIGLIGALSFFGLLRIISPSVKSWAALGACTGLVVMSAVEFVGLIVG